MYSTGAMTMIVMVMIVMVIQAGNCWMCGLGVRLPVREAVRLVAMHHSLLHSVARGMLCRLSVCRNPGRGEA